MALFYDRKDFRREILKTVYIIRFSKIQMQSLLKALRGSGFSATTYGDLEAEATYLQRKGYVEIQDSINPITKEEAKTISITEEGVDLIEGNRLDVGVEGG
jgi:hypothetical protein